MIVIDASVFVAAVIEDEQDFYSRHIYDMVIQNEHNAIVPPIFYYETANVFLQTLRRLRISEEMHSEYLRILFNFPLIIDEKQSVAEVAKIAKLYGLTVYDASYLELAIRKNFPLATLDKQLIIAARKANVELVFNDN